jgi:hypothetical protein
VVRNVDLPTVLPSARGQAAAKSAPAGSVQQSAPVLLVASSATVLNAQPHAAKTTVGLDAPATIAPSDARG